MKQLLVVLVGVMVWSSSARAEDVDRAEVRALLAKQRATNLERFHAYRLARVYPHNTYQEGMLNVWTDADGHLCAVATLMDKAGLHDIVTATAETQNTVKIADVTSGPLLDWALTSGFTQEELVMIQQPSEADIEEMEWQARHEKRLLARKLAREDDRLEGNYIETERTLKRKLVASAGLDLAVARVLQRPDLLAQLRAGSH